MMFFSPAGFVLLESRVFIWQFFLLSVTKVKARHLLSFVHFSAQSHSEFTAKDFDFPLFSNFVSILKPVKHFPDFGKGFTRLEMFLLIQSLTFLTSAYASNGVGYKADLDRHPYEVTPTKIF